MPARRHSRGQGLDWTKTIFEVIDLRSFSNLWFWIALAVVWSSASHWVLGVPFDMITRARRQGGQVAEDLDALAHINVRRLLMIARVAGLWLVGLACFFLTTLAVLGFWFNNEFAQAVFLLACPMTAVGALSLKAAARIEAGALTGPALWQALMRHRMTVQGVGVIAIFVTAMWGMYRNLNIWM